MNEFIQESLKADVFWSALASLGTLTAVLTALFLPAYNESKRIKKIEKLVESEILRNFQIAKNTNKEHTITLPDGKKQKVILSAVETTRLIRLNIWDQYKYKLADDSPKHYDKYNNIYKHIETLSKYDKINTELFPVMFQGEIESFLKKCKEELKLS